MSAGDYKQRERETRLPWLPGPMGMWASLLEMTEVIASYVSLDNHSAQPLESVSVEPLFV